MATARYLDLLQQGFMKPGRAPARKPAPPRPTVACELCCDWHAKGKHTAPAEVRAERRRAGASPVGREIK